MEMELRSHNEKIKTRMVALRGRYSYGILLMTGVANCDVYDWVGPIINSTH